jgi:hypothetical protein
MQIKRHYFSDFQDVQIGSKISKEKVKQKIRIRQIPYLPDSNLE